MQLKTLIIACNILESVYVFQVLEVIIIRMGTSKNMFPLSLIGLDAFCDIICDVFGV